MQDLLGGAPEAGGPLVSKGDTVLIKPNLLSPRDPEEAVTTHPAVVQAVVEYCFLAGAGRVWIGDSCAGEHKDQQLWEATGMAEVTRVTGAELKSFESEVVACKCGSTQLPVPGWLDEVDLWISVPKLKTHTLTVLTCAVKNTYGMVAGRVKAYYHGQYPSPQAMSRFLLQVHESLPPAYVVVDAVMAMEGNGPSNGTPAPAGLIIGGRDALAIDATCAPIFQSRTQDIPILRAALNKTPHVLDNIVVRGDGRELLDKISLKPSLGRLLLKLPEAVFGLATAVLACRPRINAEKCIACGACARICSQKAISSIPHKDSYKIDVSRCIMCMCCAEACPCHAVEVKSPLRFFQALRRLLAGKRK
ncbi:MAG: DUF362 domain-containing protein [Lentisphaeria bacterium]